MAMHPQNPASFNHRLHTLPTGRTYHFVDQIPPDYEPSTTPTLLCVHGFPDLWYGWRYQIAAWSRKFRVIVPDMLGYGSTDKPTVPAQYSTRLLSNDLAAILDLVKVEKAVLIGHDWGSFIVGRFALWHPERSLALIMMCIPFTPPSPKYFSVEELAKRAPNLSYQVYLSNDESTRQIEANLSRFVRRVYNPPTIDSAFGGNVNLKNILQGKPQSEVASKSILNEHEIEFYVSQFKKGGMRGPLSYYRTTKYRYEEEQAAKLPSKLRQDLPVLFLWGMEDPVSTPAQIQRARKWVPRQQDIGIEGTGHWLMVEAKEMITEKVMWWLDGLLTNEACTGKVKL